MEITENENNSIKVLEMDEVHNTQTHDKMEISDRFFVSAESKELNLLDKIKTSEKD